MLFALLLSGASLTLAACSLTPAPESARFDASVTALDAASAKTIISSYRAKHGMGPLIVDPALQRAAQAQALSMARAGAISHGPQPLSTRLGSVGVRYSEAAENVSAGYPSLERAIGGWQRSASHNTNLLIPGVRRMGIALAQAPGSRFGTYWALIVAD